MGIQDSGNGPKAPIEIDGNIVKANEGDGIRVLVGKGHQLKDNESGGAAKEDDNAGCEFLVDDGNINATGNKANDVLIPGANGTEFPRGCSGTDRPRR